MCAYHIRFAEPVFATIDRRDPDYDEQPSYDELADIKVEIAEERYRERRMSHDKKSRDGN